MRACTEKWEGGLGLGLAAGGSVSLQQRGRAGGAWHRAAAAAAACALRRADPADPPL